MKTDSIKNYPAVLLSQKLKQKNIVRSNEIYNVGLCNSEKYKYNGSFTGNSGAAVNILDKTIIKLSKFCNDHTSITQNLFALLLGATLRPLAIMSLPGKKNKEDKIYASGHAIASACIGFGFAYAVMSPLDSAAKKAKKMVQGIKEEGLASLSQAQIKKLKDIYNVDDLSKLADSKAFKKVSKIMDMHVDTLFLGLAKAMLTVALIPPVLKYVFGVEKGKKKDVAPVQNQDNTKGMSSFVGGNK